MKIRLTLLVLLVLGVGCSKNEQKNAQGKSDPEKIYRIGETRPVIDSRGEDVARATVEGVSAEPHGEEAWLTVHILFKNTWRESIPLYYDATALVDNEQRIYKGKLWPTRNVPDKRVIEDYRGLVDNLDPGLSKRNFVVFTMPITAFQNDVHFGFISGETGKIL